MTANGRSNLKGLYAVRGVRRRRHGSEPAGLGLDCLMCSSAGMAAGKEAARHAKESAEISVDQDLVEPEIKKIDGLFGKGRGISAPLKLKRKLQKLMLDNVGFARDETSLSAAIVEIDQMRGQAANDLAVASIRRYNSELVDSLELNNMLTCAKMIATCARLRTESRGGHLRLDYPERDDAHWLKNIAVHKENGQLVTALHPISAREDYERKAKE